MIFYYVEYQLSGDISLKVIDRKGKLIFDNHPNYYQFAQTDDRKYIAYASNDELNPNGKWTMYLLDLNKEQKYIVDPGETVLNEGRPKFSVGDLCFDVGNKQPFEKRCKSISDILKTNPVN
jgi:hypothetical protein